MGTSYTTLDARVESALRDTDDHEWSQAERIQALSDSERFWAELLAGIHGSGRFVYQETITLSANATSYAVSGLTKSFQGVRSMHLVRSNGSWSPPLQEFQEGDERILVGSTGYTVPSDVAPCYRVREDAIIFRPVSGGARSIVVNYNWLPAVKTSTGDSADTPTQYDDALVARAVWTLLRKIGARDSSWEDFGGIRQLEIEQAESNRGTRAEGEHVRTVGARSLFGRRW